jgi:hypothetical protein
LTLSSLIVAFRDLIQFRLGPQDLPHAPRLLGGLVLALIVGHFVLAQALVGDTAPSPLRVVLAPAFMLGLLYALLSIRQFTNRFFQTGLAWIGVELIFLVLSVPFLLAIGKLPTKAEELTPQQLVLMWPLLAVAIWKLAVQAHVARHALDLRLPAAILIALLTDIAVSVLFGA